MARFCHWPGCPVEMSSARLWGCRKHWFMLPVELRAEIRRTYRPGQEITKDPSVEYCEVAEAVQAWIYTNYATKDALVASSLIRIVNDQAPPPERQGRLF
jgi:hypothetical protein